LTFSIIIPAYNAENYVQQSVNSILNQTRGDFEILIADDGSRDNTKKLIDEMSDTRIKKHHNDKNQGYLKTCNKLMALAKGDFLVFQDSDDLSAPNRLEEQYEFIRQNNLDACGTWVQRIDSHGNNTTLEQLPININEGLAEGKFNFVAGTFMVHRYLIDSVGLYHSYFDRIGFEDYYWTVLIAFNFRIQNLPLPLYMYRENFESVSNNFSTLDKEFSFRSVLYLLNQKLAGLTDYLEENKEKKLKEEVLKIMLSSRLDNRNSLNKQEVKKLSIDLLKNNPISLLNWKIALKQALI
jgi:glycosyltransferase involved in cell wall biosynthesis